MSGVGAPDSPARSIKRATVVTHRRLDETQKGIEALVAAAKAAGVELRFDAAEDADRAVFNDADICFVLGGDGATLRALRGCAGTDIPVFAINFGRIGFLATVDRDNLEQSLERALAGDFEVVKLPALDLDAGTTTEFAINEVSFQRRSHLNVTHISYSVSGEEIGRSIPCDGLIAATPVGSTAYNLSVGGPIVAWGVDAFAVSLIAPHALAARPLVAAPGDELSVHNDGIEPIDVVVDGIRTGEIEPGQIAAVRFRRSAVGLAQLPGSSFYRRFREKLMGLTE
jgi:NAD+ kinase